jgi:hypothetical protein
MLESFKRRKMAAATLQRYFMKRQQCGGKINFSPPPPLGLAGGSRRGPYRDTEITETD